MTLFLVPIWLALPIGSLVLLGYAARKLFYLPEATPPTAAESHAGHLALVWFGVFIVALPAMGCAVSIAARRTLQRTIFAVFVALGLLVNGLAYGYMAAAKPHKPTPAPAVTQCLPRSGGHSCPGR